MKNPSKLGKELMMSCMLIDGAPAILITSPSEILFDFRSLNPKYPIQTLGTVYKS